jgi:hypothetical protein
VGVEHQYVGSTGGCKASPRFRRGQEEARVQPVGCKALPHFGCAGKVVGLDEDFSHVVLLSFWDQVIFFGSGLARINTAVIHRRC